jgi:hypothetical protein
MNQVLRIADVLLAVLTELFRLSFEFEMVLNTLEGFFLRKFEFVRSEIIVDALGESFESTGGRRLLSQTAGAGLSTCSNR